MRRRGEFLVAVVLFLSTAFGVDSPAVPQNLVKPKPCWPGARSHEKPQECPPNDPDYAGQWNLKGYVPDEVFWRLTPEERALGAIGSSVDRAWQATIGRPDVVIAVLDSGILWNDPDVLHQIYLNRGELPLPQGSMDYDANGDGIFNVRDYAGDRRVKDRNGNGILDAEDIVLAFSASGVTVRGVAYGGVDNDGNGYVDDIAGFDFFRRDNNPSDETEMGHGTKIAKWAAAETNNGIGIAGVCPRCRVLPVRVGDSYVVEANRFADGVYFAMASGATVVAASLGSVNFTPYTEEAMRAAFAQGIPIVAAAADEYSYHHNFPAISDRALVVNSIRHDGTESYQGAGTFWALNGCSNYGPRVSLASPSLGCASEGTALVAGIVGLLQSFALERRGALLSPSLLYSILQSTADDLSVPAWDRDDAHFPAKEGFDEIHGHGRPNAFRALQAVLPGRSPPGIDITHPTWFEIVTEEEARSVRVEGIVSMEGASPGSLVVEAARGSQPNQSEFIAVATQVVRDPRTPFRAVLDLSGFVLSAGGLVEDSKGERDRYLITLRVRVRAGGVESEARRTIFLFRDPSWKQGFPIRLPASSEAAPLVVHTAGEPDRLVVSTSDGALRILQWTSSGPKWANALFDEFRWPISARKPSRRETTMTSMAVGDILGTGERVLVSSSIEGKVYTFHLDGRRAAGFPVAIDPSRASPTNKDQEIESGLLSAPILANIYGDAAEEILVTSLDGHLYAWTGEGRPVPGFPVPISDPTTGKRSKIVSTPAVGDIDGDGRVEILFGTNEIRRGRSPLFAVRSQGLADPKGPFVKGWDPLWVSAVRSGVIRTVAWGMPATPALVDVDGDQDLEVVANALTGEILLFDHSKAEGKEGPRLLLTYDLMREDQSELGFVPFVAGLGSPLVTPSPGGTGHDLFLPLLPKRFLTLSFIPGTPVPVPMALGGWNLVTGDWLDGYPRPVEDLMFAKPKAALMGENRERAIVIGSGGYWLHAFSDTGGEVTGFPKFTGGWSLSASDPADLDGDGRKEIYAATREGWLFGWDL